MSGKLAPRAIAIFVAGFAAGAFAEDASVAALSHIHGIAFDPGTPGQILLATHHGVYKASPDGLTVKLSSTSDDFMGFTRVPGSAVLVGSGHPEAGGNMGFISSTDGGSSWEKVSDGANGPVDFHAVSVSPVDPQVIYGLYGGVQVSRDGGRTWDIAGPGPGRPIDLAAHPTDENRLFAAAGDGLYESTDNATSWTKISPQVPVTMIESTPDGRIFAFFVGVGLLSKAAGADWTVRSQNDLAGSEFLHLALDPADANHLVAVTQASEVLESRDGGATWEPFGR